MPNNKPTRKAITLRLPPKLHQWLQRRAAHNTRSLNAELVHLLTHFKASQDDA